MLVICAYLSAMAGVTALCYVFRRRPADGDEGNGCLPNSGHKNIKDTPQPTDDSKAKARCPVTPDSEAKIQQVLDVVNTPEETSVPLLENQDKVIEESVTPPRSVHSSRCGDNKKDPGYTEVIDDIKQSQAKVEAWISELGKAINPVESAPKESSPTTSAVKYNHVSLAADARKKANEDRLAKIKEETARRRTVLNNRMEANKRHEAEREKEREKERERDKERERERERVREERKTDRKRWSSSLDNGTGILYKREVIEIPKKRAHGESANSGGSVKSKPSKTSQASKRVASTSDDNRGTKRTSATKEYQAGTSRGRPQMGRTAATHSDAEEKEVVGRGSTRLDAKVRGTPRAAGSAYSPKGTSTRQLAPSSSTGRSHSQVPSSRIPVMVNSRSRPPVVRPAEREPRVTKVKEKVTPPTVTQKLKKNIRISTPHPSQRFDDLVAVPSPSASPDETFVYETASHHAGCFQREDVAQAVELPKLDIIDVKETHSSSTFHVLTETPSGLGINDTRGAQSGPIRLDRDISMSKLRRESIAALRASLSQTRPSRDGGACAISKTVKLPEGTDSNVTVYFAVTMPRHPKSNPNLKGSNERLVTEIDSVVNGNDDDIDGNYDKIDGDNHSDDEVFQEELEICYPEDNGVKEYLYDEHDVGRDFDVGDEQ